MAKEGGGATVATAWVQIMPTMKDGQSNIVQAMAGSADAAGKKTGEGIGAAIKDRLGSMMGNFASLGGDIGTNLFSGFTQILSGAGSAAIIGGAAAIGAAVVEGFKGLEEVGATFDSMQDAIVIGTGASGAALEGLSETAKNIATTVPTSFDEAADTVQFFNTRMGMTGDNLQAVGERVAAVGSMMGESVNLDKLTGAFNAFGVSNDEAASKMDYMFGVAQNTGIGFNELTQTIQGNAPAMTQMGFSFEETANMAGMLSKAGLDANGMMSKMSKGLTTLAQPGEDAKDAFNRVTQEIQGYIASGDQASAIDVASKVFGTRGAAQFITAVQSGAMSLDQLGSSALGASGDIMKTHEATADWPETWELIKNRMAAALEPMGSAVFSALGATLEGLSSAMDFLYTACEPLFQVINNLVSGAFAMLEPTLAPLGGLIDSVGVSFGSILADSIRVVANVLNVLGDGIAIIWSAIQPLATFLVSVLAVGFQSIVSVISIVVDIIAQLSDGFSAFADWLMTALQPCIDVFTQWGDIIGSFAQTVLQFCTDAENGIGSFVSNIGSAVMNFFANLPQNIWNFIQGIPQFFSDIFGGVPDFASNAVSGILSFITGLPASIWNSILSIPSKFMQAFKDNPQEAKKAVDGIGDFVRSLPGKIWDWISSIPGKFAQMFSQIHIPTFHIEGSFNLDPANFQLPHIAFYARGGFIDKPTAIVGEAGGEFVWPSYEPYLSAYGSALSRYIDTGDSRNDTAAVIGWLEKNLGHTIKENAPTATPREFARMVDKVRAR